MREAIDEKWSYADFLERLLEDEVERRQQKQLWLRLRRADLSSDKTLETFDFSFNPSVNRQQFYDLATGVGKSHLAQALAHEGCRRGFDVVYTNAHRMLRHLSAARADNSYDKRLALYVRPDLLVIDDFGLKPLTAASSEDLYDIIDERYLRGSVIFTTNLEFPRWTEVFGDPQLTGALLDRITHQCHIIECHSDSPVAMHGIAIIASNKA